MFVAIFLDSQPQNHKILESILKYPIWWTFAVDHPGKNGFILISIINDGVRINVLKNVHLFQLRNVFSILTLRSTNAFQRN
jgi:hypothetical protein